jgi:hypothetical protein
MAKYSLKTFLRNTPNSLLKEYFRQQGCLESSQWITKFSGGELNARCGNDIEILFEEINNLQRDHFETVEQDFTQICSMADQSGVDCLIELSSNPVFNRDLAGEFETNSVEGSYGRAMWVWMYHRDLFMTACCNHHLDSISSWKDCNVGANLPCGGDEHTLDALSAEITEYLKDKAKGRHCHVDYYYRDKPGRHCFFAYPEGSGKTELRYDKSRLTSSCRRPVFEVVFIYEPETGVLKVHARGKKTAVDFQRIFCQKALNLDGVPDKSSMVYDLSKLKDPSFRFDVGINIERIKLKNLLLDFPGSEQALLKIEPGDCEEMKLRQRMADVAGAYGYELSSGSVIIKRVKMQAIFKPLNGRRAKTVTFELGLPDISNLHDSAEHNLIKTLIDKWGFRRALLENN